MVESSYIPEKGDLVWLNFTPQSGHEQAGKRPAIVLSASAYNEKTSLMIACPITSIKKGYPFEVNIKGKKIEGVVLTDQVKNLDWRARKTTFIEKAPGSTLHSVQNKLILLIQ